MDVTSNTPLPIGAIFYDYELNVDPSRFTSGGLTGSDGGGT